mmetsp:Transcript_4546/g.7309  ORF Transcript_4546/g.7309 Transcript_4546/m.7309 type:complete len:237 (+) Transcript_4546:190-900(+)
MQKQAAQPHTIRSCSPTSPAISRNILSAAVWGSWTLAFEVVASLLPVGIHRCFLLLRLQRIVSLLQFRYCGCIRFMYLLHRGILLLHLSHVGVSFEICVFEVESSSSNMVLDTKGQSGSICTSWLFVLSHPLSLFHPPPLYRILRLSLSWNKDMQPSFLFICISCGGVWLPFEAIWWPLVVANPCGASFNMGFMILWAVGRRAANMVSRLQVHAANRVEQFHLPIGVLTTFSRNPL